jgi:hypothetical protein
MKKRSAETNFDRDIVCKKRLAHNPAMADEVAPRGGPGALPARRGSGALPPRRGSGAQLAVVCLQPSSDFSFRRTGRACQCARRCFVSMDFVLRRGNRNAG